MDPEGCFNFVDEVRLGRKLYPSPFATERMVYSGFENAKEIRAIYNFAPV
jgi:hypothetical protein